jgi:CelD/BcsL family acetyltransferase involved in cellulose biosynthesis
MSTWSRETRDDRSVFEDLAPWWNQCPGPQSTPFLRTEWFRLWCDSFLPDRSRLEVVLWKRDGSVVAALPLSRSGLKRSSLANSHTDVSDLVAAPDPEAPSVVRQWLAGVPVTRLFRLDGQSLLLPVEPDANWLADRRAEVPFADLSKGIEGLTAGMGRNLRKNLRRLERRAAELGEVVYLDNADGVVPDALEECMKLEASGWKGKEGTAMISRPESARFYRDLVELARDRGWLRICALLISERVAAFELDLDYHGRRF